LVAAPAWLFFRVQVRNPLVVALAGSVALLPTWFAMVELRAASPTLLLALLALVWLADSAAYFAGRRFGRRKLAPAISPKKTWEGVAGAFVIVTLYAAGICAFLAPGASLARIASGIVFAWVMLYLAVLGDLFESWMKREAGLKDSGQILPGHGGLLDRIDALTAALPLGAFVVLRWNPW
jgi:phosphatidate cytidylyltransferase